MEQTTLELIVSKPEKMNYMMVEFIGSLDSYFLGLKRKELYKLVSDLDKPNLIFNFGKLDYINSESIGMLIEVSAGLVEKGKHLIIVSAKRNVWDVLKTVGLFQTIACYKTMEEFVSKNQ